MAEPGTAAAFLAALKRFGVDVVEEDGWRTHNRDDETGKKFGPLYGVMIHHTAGVTKGAVSFCKNGSARLPGPLCHGVILKSGKVHLVGWGRANHAGGGDPDVLAAVKAERYPLPKPNEHDGSDGAVDGNDAFVGFECVNKGDGTDPWPAAQLDAMKRATAAVCWLYGWSARSALRHLDWSDWKSDPKGVDWDDFLADVQKLLDDERDEPQPPTKPDPKPLPLVSLKHVVAAAKRDPGLPQGGATYRAEVDLVEEALVKLGYLEKRWADGSFGTKTLAAYRLLQKHLGYVGADADGVPGSHSLTWLGQKTQLFRKGN
jgi:N-acetylmuramoyl-L-alanine amidase